MRGTLLKTMLLCMLSWSFVVTGAIGATEEPLTNADIIKLIKAELGDETIVHAIQTSPSNFDTSPDALVVLKKAGATRTILNAVLTAKAPTLGGTPISVEKSTDAQQSAQTVADAALSTNDVILIDGSTRTQLKQSSGTTLYKQGQGFFLRNIAWYVVSGSHSDVQISNSTPAFEFAFSSNLKVKDLVALQTPDVSGDSRRIELAVAGPFVNQDTLRKRNLPIVIEEVKGQSMFGGTFARYLLKPASPLPAGEYFMSIGGSYYDFGVETAK